MSGDRTGDNPEWREAAPWFKESFGPFYQKLYGHRDDREARSAVDLLAGHLPVAVTGGSRLPILDIACGAGRHLRALGERGYDGVGLDLSWFLLRSARAASGDALVRADMRRLPFRNAVFGAAMSMFTSLGYFKQLDGNRSVLAEAARVLAPGGGLAVDYFNARTTLANLVPSGVRTVGRYEVREARHVRCGDEEIPRIDKTIEIFDAGTLAETFREEVLALDHDQVTGLVEEAGFEVLQTFGDYDGSAFRVDRSSRFIAIARRSAE